MSESTVDEQKKSPVQKQRHGCLTAYLILMVIAHIAVLYIFFFYALGSVISDDREILVFLIGMFFNFVCIIALFSWKKWGFWGLVASSVVSFFLNLSMGKGGFSILGLVGLLILYGVLHIGGKKNGWAQLD